VSELSGVFEEKLDITTGVVCSNNCAKYCPQEVFVQKYPADKVQLLSVADFKMILSTVPKNVIVSFSGFCEPFVNPAAIEMMQFANESGYSVELFTTLRGASIDDVNKLLTIPFHNLCLHLPDGQVLAFPLTQEYMLNVFKVIQGVRNALLMTMNDNFITNNRENVARGINLKPHRSGRCHKRVLPQFVVIPNGDVHLCCQDFGLEHRLGNLLTEDYALIRSRFFLSKKYNLCRFCTKDLPVHIDILRRIVLKFRDSRTNSRYNLKKSEIYPEHWSR
jgi:hypothetical protein